MGCISDPHPLNKIWSAWVEPLTLAGSWSPSSLLINLGRGQWFLFFHDHLLLDHSRVEVIGLFRLVVRRNLVVLMVHLVHFLTVLRIAVEGLLSVRRGGRSILRGLVHTNHLQSVGYFTCMSWVCHLCTVRAHS